MIRFGAFTLDEGSGELRRDGVLVPLAPQPFRLLHALASRPGELVTREELRQQVWGDGTFVDFERGLNFAILQTRTALGDNAKQPAFIETLPRRGYRFIAAVESPIDAPATPVVAAIPPPRTRRLSLLTAAAALIVFIVVAALQRAELAPSSTSTALRPASPAAHDAYLRGRQLWSAGDTASTEASVVELRAATKLEPSFVLAHVALAESLHVLAMRGKIDARAATAEIRNASDTALRLAPSLAQTHAITAMLRFWHEWDWDGAERSYAEAIRLNPNEPGALHDHGWLLIVRGKFAEGIAEIRRAQELDPLSPRANMHVAWVYTYTGQYVEAVRESRRALELAPGYPEAWHCLEQAYLLSGNYASALAARKQYDREPAASDPRAFYDELRAKNARAIEADDPYATAVRFAQIGDRDRALTWLTKARDDRRLSFVLAGVDPKLAPLHGDARYVELLRSVGLEPVTRPTR